MARFAQLALNLAWSAAFSGAAPRKAWLAISMLWLAIIATVGLSAPVQKPAGALLLPYLAWTSFAAALNLSTWQRNR